jgi:HD-GYP domain-containing protein (c-di-GMP phosphodiesterase class II)
VPDHILTKAASLTHRELEVMRNHPARGAEIVGQTEEMARVSDAIRHHHERPDGRGYPDGLRGDAIPITSRIIFVADAFEAMTSNRSYRRGQERERAFEELRRKGGSQLDPELVEVFVTKVKALPTV